MFRVLSTTSGASLLRCPSTLRYIRQASQAASLTPKPPTRAKRKPRTKVTASSSIKVNPERTEDGTEELKKKPVRRKVKTGSDADSATAQEGEKGREGSAVKDVTANKKGRPKTNAKADLEQLGTEARDGEGIVKYLKATKMVKGVRHPTFDYKRVHIVSKSLCGKDPVGLCVILMAYSS